LLLFLFGSAPGSSAQVFSLQSGGGQLAATNILSPVPNSGTLLIDYNFFAVPDTMDVYYGGTDIFSSGLVSYSGQFVIPYGPGPDTSLMIVMNQGGTALPATVWQYQPTIVPEPGFLSLLALGFFSVGAFCRRRNLVSANSLLPLRCGV
jgi:hypothetical protein